MEANLSSLKDICRCCHTNGCFKSLKEPYTFREKEEVYCKMLIETFGLLIIPPTLEASYTICDDCIVRLRDSTKFRYHVEACEEKFNQIYNQLLQKTVVKVEFNHDEAVNENDRFKIENDEVVNLNANTVNCHDNENEDDNIRRGNNVDVNLVRYGLTKGNESEGDLMVNNEVVNVKDENSNFDKLTDNDDDIENEYNNVIKGDNCDDDDDDDRVEKIGDEHGNSDHNGAESDEYLDKKGFQEALDVDKIVISASKYALSNGSQIHVRKSELLRQRHSNKVVKKRKCRRCHAAFDTVAQLQEHFKMHREDKVCICDVCGKSIKKCYMKTHIDIHMGKNTKSLEQNSIKRTDFIRPKKIQRRCNKDCSKSTCLSCRFCYKHVRVAFYERHLLSHVGETECIKCGKIFDTKDRLREHANIHASEYAYTCDVCKKTYNKRGALKRHIVDVHLGTGRGRAKSSTETGYRIDPSKYLKDQTLNPKSKAKCDKKRKDITLLECRFCDREINETSYERHLKSHVGDTECIKCGRAFDTRNILHEHARQHEAENRYTCDLCGKWYLIKGVLKRHIDMHMGRNRQFMCHECGHSFNDVTQLKKHTSTVHRKMKSFECVVCKKFLSTKKALIQHMRIHTGERPYACDVCGKTFICYTGLRKHKSRHNVEDNRRRSFHCKVCEITFDRRVKLVYHSRIHHPESGYRTNKRNYSSCSHCLKVFTQPFSLRRHLMKKHTPPTEWIKKAICDICSKVFVDKYEFLRHYNNIHATNGGVRKKVQCKLCKRKVLDIKAHTAMHLVRPMRCEICGKRYPTQERLDIHVNNVHRGLNKTFQCELCTHRPYAKRCYLKKHMLKAHCSDLKSNEE